MATDIESARADVPDVPDVPDAPGERRFLARVARRPRRAVAAVVAVLGLVLIAAAAIGFGGGSAPTSPHDGLPPATAQVARGTLTQTQQVGGLISYGEPVGLMAQGPMGTITWIAGSGSEVGLGEPIYRIDDKPVVLIRGTIPMYRDLGIGAVGPDVAQLEQSLHKLGYTGFAVDKTYDTATADAVAVWQKNLGWTPTGVVKPDQVLVHDGDIRIALPALTPGSQLTDDPNQQVLSYSGTTQVATIPLDVDKQHLVDPGDPATITLPDGTTLPGVVQSVGTVAQTIESPDGSGGAGGSGDTFVTMIVSISDQKALAGGYDSAPVTVQLVTAVENDVLTVPVTALAPAPGGGYAVEVVDGGSASFVSVEMGMFAQGMVEISGPGISEGTTVGVAA